MSRRERQHQLEKCTFPLITSTRRHLFKTVSYYERLIKEAQEAPPNSDVVFSIAASPSVDPGGILLMKYTGWRIHLAGRNCMVQGFGQVMNTVTDNLDHYITHQATQAASVPGLQMPPPSPPSQPGSYLMRGIKSAAVMVKELINWAETVQRGTTATEEQVSVWQTQIAEVTTNAFQHAKSEGGGLGGQVLIAGHATPQQVQLASLDVGHGIPAIIGKVSRGIATDGSEDGRLIAHAFKKGVTSRCVPENQGAGLDSLARSVRASQNGSLQVLSRNGYFRVVAGKRNQRRDLVPPDGGVVFHGTLTIINLGLNPKTD